MSTPIEELQTQVLDLPAEERAKLLELLIASFEPKTEAQEAWVQEAVRRRNEVRAGRLTIRPGEEALARVRSRLA